MCVRKNFGDSDSFRWLFYSAVMVLYEKKNSNKHSYNMQYLNFLPFCYRLQFVAFF